MILKDYKKFIDRLFAQLEEKGIDTSELKIDHLGYQASSTEDYNEKKSELKKFGEVKQDTQVGEKKVAIFKLFKPLEYKDQIIEAIEIVSPKLGQKVDSDWEHIEVIPHIGLENFIQKYPNVEWDTSVIDREIFPMLILRLDEKTRVKFPRRAVLKEVERIKKA